MPAENQQNELWKAFNVAKAQPNMEDEACTEVATAYPELPKMQVDWTQVIRHELSEIKTSQLNASQNVDRDPDQVEQGKSTDSVIYIYSA